MNIFQFPTANPFNSLSAKLGQFKPTKSNSNTLPIPVKPSEVTAQSTEKGKASQARRTWTMSSVALSSSRESWMSMSRTVSKN
mmetsp:Transcript_36778/g.58938  ORF Transcript_36778/g.58938 Transcript_36778/m.58938 type:complete len:83 (+) Transcript_36778:81-329(+)